FATLRERICFMAKRRSSLSDRFSFGFGGLPFRRVRRASSPNSGIQPFLAILQPIYGITSSSVADVILSATSVGGINYTNVVGAVGRPQIRWAPTNAGVGIWRGLCYPLSSPMVIDRKTLVGMTAAVFGCLVCVFIAFLGAGAVRPPAPTAIALATGAGASPAP